MSPGDMVLCTASVTDGYGGSDSDSASVTIDNTAPVVDSVSISPSTGIDSTTPVTCSYTASDVDGDAVTASYSWVNHPPILRMLQRRIQYSSLRQAVNHPTL